MVATTKFPGATTVSRGLFADPTTYGLVQGTAFPDPSTRWRLRGGILAQAETIPMWGGVGIFQDVPGGAGAPIVALGPQVGRATAAPGHTAGCLAGFAVFDQAYGMVTDPSSPVPLAGSGEQVMFYPLGSLARIAVAADPALLSLQGGPTSAQVSWDSVNQLLVPYDATTTTTIASGVYNNATGEVTLTLTAPLDINPGDAFTVSSATGTGSFAAINGTFTAGPDTTGATVDYVIAAGLTMTITGGNIAQDVFGPIPVNVLDVQVGNCQTVVYDPVKNTASWNYNGTAAVIQL